MRRAFFSLQDEWKERRGEMEKVWIGYLILCNVCGLVLMKVDKERAKKHRWRIPEKTLFLVALLGGSAGAWLGMYLFHHKTKHWYFVVGMPLILICQIALAWLLIL